MIDLEGLRVQDVKDAVRRAPCGAPPCWQEYRRDEVIRWLEEYRSPEEVDEILDEARKIKARRDA